MKRIPFDGRAFSIDELLTRLRSQGLEIEDEERARHILENVSYTRLKNYLVFLMEDRRTHRFYPGSSFEKAYALYGFDRRLRELIFHELEKIEISIRTHIAFASNGKERGFWFLNPAHFKNAKHHKELLRRIRSELERSDNEAIIHFYSKYTDDFPPCWLTLEATSMGVLSIIYKEMAEGEMKDRIAGYYGLTPDILESWLRHLVAVRNNCAHHNRMWNSPAAVRADIPSRTGNPFPHIEESRQGCIYTTLCILRYLQNVVKPGNTFARRLRTLVGNFEMVDPAYMGFPEGWTELPFWKDAVSN